MPDDNLSESDDNRQTDEAQFLENVKSALLKEAGIDLNQENDLGQLLYFQPGQSEKGSGFRYALDTGEYNGSLAQPVEIDPEKAKESLDMPKTDQQKKIIYDIAARGRLFVRAADGSIYQVSQKSAGKPDVELNALNTKSGMNHEPELKLPQEPMKPGFFQQLLHAITGGWLFHRNFEDYRIGMENIAAAKEAHTNPVNLFRKQQQDAQMRTSAAKYAKEAQNRPEWKAYNQFWQDSHDPERAGEKDRAAHPDDYRKKDLKNASQEKKNTISVLNEIQKNEPLLAKRSDYLLGQAPGKLSVLNNSDPFSQETIHPAVFDQEAADYGGFSSSEIADLSLTAFACTEYSGAHNPHERIFHNKEDLAGDNFREAVNSILSAEKDAEAGNPYQSDMLKARQDMQKALIDFQYGRTREDIGRMLAEGLRQQEKPVRAASDLSPANLAFFRIVGNTVELLDKHPKLKYAAMNYGHLTEKELATARGIGNIPDFVKEGLEAKKRILDSDIKHLSANAAEKLSPEENARMTADRKSVDLMNSVGTALDQESKKYSEKPEFKEMVDPSKESNHGFYDVPENAGKNPSLNDEYDERVRTRAGIIASHQMSTPLPQIYDLFENPKALKEAWTKAPAMQAKAPLKDEQLQLKPAAAKPMQPQAPGMDR